MSLRTLALIAGFAVSLFGCISIPEGLKPVTGFEASKYMGKWYEIARLDHSFERNLSHVSATYTQTKGGTIRVKNKGFDTKKGAWKQIEGRARFIGSKRVGSLKVSFFKPFYGGYHIIVLDQSGYNWAMVAGPSLNYLWILARQKVLDDAVYDELVAKASAWGFKTADLIKVKHDRAWSY